MLNFADVSLLHDRLDKVRLYLNLTHDQFLTLIEISCEDYELIIKGKKNLPSKKALFLHRHYNISIKWLQEGSGSMRVLAQDNPLSFFRSERGYGNVTNMKPPISKLKEHSGSTKASFSKYDKDLLALEDKISDTLFSLRRTLLKTLNLDTFDKHEVLCNGLRDLRIRLQHTDYNPDEPWLSDLLHFKENLKEETVFLLQKIEEGYEQKVNSISNKDHQEEMNSSWRIYKSNIS